MSKFQIIGLKVSDLRAIDLIEVNLKDHQWIEITGENGGGKSTLIDALFLALQGTKHAGRGYPAWRLIKQGKDRAIMKVTIGNAEREIEIKRSITKKERPDGSITTTSSLSIKDTAGEKLSQAELDSLISEFTVDPLSFAAKSPVRQAEIARELSGIDTSEIEKTRAETYTERTLVNRELKTLQSNTAEPVEEIAPVDVSDLIGQRDQMQQRNTAREGIERERVDLTSEISGVTLDIEKLGVELQRATSELSQLPEAEPEESTETLDLKISEATETNHRAQVFNEWTARVASRDAAAEKSGKLTEQIDSLDEQKSEMLKSSKLPFKNIEIDDEAGLVIGGIPFAQKSTAEQIQISARIGMELSPDLRVLCIKEGSTLDLESVKVLRTMAERHGYQILVERVGEVAGVDKIVLRAGKLISEFEEVQTAEQKANRLEDEL